MQKIRLLTVLNFAAFIIHVGLSYLSNNPGVLSDKNVGEISDQYLTVFTPAGITFAIWGVIYISLFAFCTYHLVKAFRNGSEHRANQDILAIGWLFIINNTATALWLVVWVNTQLLFSVILILIQLITLILISIRLNLFDIHRSATHKTFTQFPLSIYFAWICIATIANISTYLVSVNWSGLGISDAFWAIIMIGAATLISLFVILIRRNSYFGLVVLWAFYGIVLKRREIDAGLYQDVILAAWAAFAIIALAEAIQIVKNIRQKDHHPSTAETA